MGKAKGLIPIQAAQAISEKYKAPVVVLFAIHPDQKNFTMVSYGETKKLCKLAACYADNLAMAVLGCAEIAQEEPKDLPDRPAQWRGSA